MTDTFVPDFARVENGALAGRFVACFWQPIAASKDYAPSVVKRIKILGNHYTACPKPPQGAAMISHPERVCNETLRERAAPSSSAH
jgi:hypothetical protein